MTRIVTAPFALLGSLFGGGEDLAFVDFAPGSAALGPDAAQKLGTLTKALVERPQLKLDIPLSAHTADDADALARAALLQIVPPAVAPGTDIAALEQRLIVLQQAGARLGGAPLSAAPAAPPGSSSSATGTPTVETLQRTIAALEQSLLEKLAPTAAQLESLGRSRAEAVQGALLGSGEVAGERVFLTTRESGEQASSASVRMELKLE